MKNMKWCNYVAYILFGIVMSIGGPVAAQQGDTEETLKPAAAPKKYSAPVPMVKGPLPKHGHWSVEIGRGKQKVVEGVLLERAPFSRKSVVAPSLSEQPPRHLIEELKKYPRGDATRRAEVLKKFAVWSASYYGRHLPKAEEQRLADLYERAAQESAALKNKDLSEDERKAQELKRSQFLVAFLLEERDILRKYPNAQLKRYGRVVATPKSREPGIEERKALESDALHFLRGDDTEGDKKGEATSAAAEKSKAAFLVPGERIGTFHVVNVSYKPPEMYELLEKLRGLRDPCSTLSTWTETSLVEGPSALSLVDRVFVAEHPVTGQTWEDFGLPSLYHTSVVVGRWWVEKRVEEVSTYTCTQLDKPPTVTTRRQQIITPRFVTWGLGHGAAGTYRSDDSLREVASFAAEGDNAVEVLNKQLYGATADDDGDRCRSRYGAYPIGFYGLNWVCHQNVNAFTLSKWSFMPVFYPESFFYAGLGWVGNLGIADIDAPCQCPDTHANHCCIPGNNCCWASTYGRGDGWGFGLEAGWHPTKGWIDTECKYSDQSIPINGWDEPSVIVPLN